MARRRRGRPVGTVVPIERDSQRFEIACWWAFHGMGCGPYDAARRALATAFEKPPVIVGEGGSIPVVGDFERILGAPVLLVGFGLPGENAHAPDEWMSEENFCIGMRAMATFWDEYGSASKTS